LNTPEKRTRELARVPLRRIGQPKDIAGIVLFLSGPSGAYVNGATIAVDGGWLVSGQDLTMAWGVMEQKARL
jgi:NAD(P)-dependent dehydrogenase (short-subunit alcohol dehydrogenase family)